MDENEVTTFRIPPTMPGSRSLSRLRSPRNGSLWISGRENSRSRLSGLEDQRRTILLDDGLARQIAHVAHLQVWGTLTVLLESKQRGLTEAIAPHLQRLEEAGRVDQAGALEPSTPPLRCRQAPRILATIESTLGKSPRAQDADSFRYNVRRRMGNTARSLSRLAASFERMIVARLRTRTVMAPSS